MNLVFIHEAGDDHRQWRRQREFFGGSHAILDVDLSRRSLRTEEAPAGFYETHAREVLRRMDAVRMARAVLVGHATGGAVAMTIAVGSPERVDALVLVATDGRLPPVSEAGEVAAVRAPATRLARRATAHVASRVHVRPAVAAIRAPTLVIGCHDPRNVTLQPAEALAASIAGAESLVLPDCGRHPEVEQEAAFTFNLEMFLGRFRIGRT